MKAVIERSIVRRPRPEIMSFRGQLSALTKARKGVADDLPRKPAKIIGTKTSALRDQEFPNDWIRYRPVR